ncbi:MAG: hypothetical protein Kow0010_08850 [Dehalococcoidia bacterium]
MLWDGDCGFCARFARWVERNDRGGRLRVIPYQQAPAPPMTPALASACAEAVHVVTARGRVFRGGRAVLFVLGVLGWHRAARFFSRKPLIWAVEAGYDLVAAHRPFFDRLLCGWRGGGPARTGRTNVRTIARKPENSGSPHACRHRSVASTSN